MSDHERDPELERALARRRVPDHRPGFWNELERHMTDETSPTRSIPRWVPLAAVAAAVAVVAGVGVVLARDGDDGTDVRVAGTTTTTAAVTTTAGPATPTTTAPAPTAPSPTFFAGGADLGTGRLAGVADDARLAWVLDPDPASDETGCEGAPVDVLWAVRADGQRIPATDDPAVAGLVVTGPDDRVAVVGQCEEFTQGIWVGTRDADGTLDVEPVPLDDLTTSLVRGFSVRFAPDGRLTAVVSAEEVGAPARFATLDPSTGEMTVEREGRFLDAALLGDDVIVTVEAGGPVTVDGTEVGRLSETNVFSYAIGGDRVAFSDGGDLVLVDASAAEVDRLGLGGPAREVALSPDGRVVGALTDVALSVAGPSGRSAIQPPPLGFGLAVTDTALALGSTMNGRVVTVSPVAEVGQGVGPPTTTTIPGEGADLAGEPFDGPRPDAGDRVIVVGVAADDGLNVRAGPGTDEPVLFQLAPLGVATATGSARLLPESIWYEVDGPEGVGWVSAAFVAEPGRTDDATAGIVDTLGATPTAETLLDLARTVAGTAAADEPPSDVSIVAGPDVGDLGEVTVDVTNLPDDALYGVRLHVFATEIPSGEGFELRTVERTLLCRRGVTDDGLCT